MNLEIEIKDGFILPKKTTLKDGNYIAKVSNMDLRSIAQNKAFHLYFTLLSVALNDAGYSFTKVIKDEKLYKMDIDWSPNLIKENLWRPIQGAILKKKSTTELTKEEVTRIYDNLNRYTSERMGISVPFPTYEIKEKKD